jgi:hypothetical protein
MTPAVGWPISTRHPTSLSFLCLERLRGCFSADGAGPNGSPVKKKNGIEVKRKSSYIERVMLLQKLTQLWVFPEKKPPLPPSNIFPRSVFIFYVSFREACGHVESPRESDFVEAESF